MTSYREGDLLFDREHQDYVVIAEVYKEDEEVGGNWENTEEEAIAVYNRYLNTHPDERYVSDTWHVDEYPVDKLRNVEDERCVDNWRVRMEEQSE